MAHECMQIKEHQVHDAMQNQCKRETNLCGRSELSVIEMWWKDWLNKAWIVRYGDSDSDSERGIVTCKNGRLKCWLITCTLTICTCIFLILFFSLTYSKVMWHLQKYTICKSKTNAALSKINISII